MKHVLFFLAVLVTFSATHATELDDALNAQISKFSASSGEVVMHESDARDSEDGERKDASPRSGGGGGAAAAAAAEDAGPTLVRAEPRAAPGPHEPDITLYFRKAAAGATEYRGSPNLKVHRAVLGKSAFFNYASTWGGEDWNKDNTVEMKAQSLESAKAFLFFLYSGDLPNLRWFDLSEFLELCHSHSMNSGYEAAGRHLNRETLRGLTVADVAKILNQHDKFRGLNEKHPVAKMRAQLLREIQIMRIMPDGAPCRRADFGELPALLTRLRAEKLSRELTELFSNIPPEIASVVTVAYAVDHRARERAALEESKRQSEAKDRELNELAQRIARRAVSALLASGRIQGSITVPIRFAVGQELQKLQPLIDAYVARDLKTYKVQIDPNSVLLDVKSRLARAPRHRGCCVQGGVPDAYCTWRSCASQTFACVAAMLCLPCTVLTCDWCQRCAPGDALCSVHTYAECDKGCYQCMNCCRTDVTVSVGARQLDALAAASAEVAAPPS